MTARAAAQYLNLKVLDDFAAGSTRQSETYALTGAQRRIWRFSARGSGGHA
jgi:hypothetical protein